MNLSGVTSTNPNRGRSGYADPGIAVRNLSAMARPRAKIHVSEASAEYVWVKTPGGGYDRWNPLVVPSLIEPMNLLTSRKFEAVVFVGPARDGKTQALIDNALAYVIKCDPSDAFVVQMTKAKAGDFAKLRLQRMIRNSPELKRQLSGRADDDNVFQKFFKNGAFISIGWPTANQFASSEYKYVFLTDYDRMPQDIGGEGSPFVLGKKRTTTYLSRGMTAVESSPSFELSDPSWEPSTLHEAPPVKGIMSLYNMGDRRRLYWCCPHCDEYYMQAPGIEGFVFPHNKDLFGFTDSEIRGDVGVLCTNCGAVITENYKPQMGENSIWVPEGVHIEREGKEYGLVGNARQSKIASYWKSGAAAAYQNWRSIVQGYLNGLVTYETTGDEEALKTAINVDMGAVYIPQRLVDGASKIALKDRAEKITERYYVPDEVRGLVATVDVQGGENRRWDVQVHGIGVGNQKWIVDRYSITDSKRALENGKFDRVNPAAHIEDWNLITEKVVNSTYKLGDGREMRVYRVGIDTGGEAGVTERAYEYWRSLRMNHLSDRVRLVKGRDGLEQPKVKLSYPDSTNRKDRNSGARGDVPVLMLNTNKIKDNLQNDLEREISGPGFIHFPDWLQDWFYKELQAEQRGDDGKWFKIRSRNEAWDLLVYCYALLIELGIVNTRIDWDRPPNWLKPWDDNSEVITREQRIALQDDSKALAKKRVPQKRQTRFRFN